jgi:hypothetical protein
MLEIYKFALSQGKILGDRLIEALASTDVVLEATCAAILGLINPDEVIAKLPKTVKSKNGNIRTMTSANFYRQIVYYDDTYSSERYFQTEEEAKKYAETGDYDYRTSSNYKKDEYPFLGVKIYQSSGDCSFDEWLTSEPVGNYKLSA